MWTPRRIGLLVVGFLFYLTSYLAYARSHLGVIDGLPALPEAYQRPDNMDGHTVVAPPNRIKPVEVKLIQAYGRDCEELKRPIKLELHSRNMVLAAGHFEIADDKSGRVMLKPVSLAMFGKNKPGDSRFVEINTIRCDQAFLTFDRPVASVSDISGRKMTGAELIGNIVVVNNRRIEARTDDLTIYISKGPVYYREDKHLIWTHDNVALTDIQSKPRPTQIFGKGMEMELLAETPAKAGAPGGRKAKQDNITGVKRIVLQSDVSMTLYVDAGSSFPAGTKEEPPVVKKAAVPVTPAKAQIKIISGRFQYDFGKDKEYDVARFEEPDTDPLNPARRPKNVIVTRIPLRPGMPMAEEPSGPQDQLNCQRLVLHLRRKEQPGAKKDNSKPHTEGSPEQGTEIESAHATGPEVTLTSDSEKLTAECVDLFHDTRTATTTLKGNPQMKATKDGNEIHARELQLQEIKLPPDKSNPQGKKFQQVNAKGPGHLDMLDSATKKRTLHAFWNDRLVSGRDGPHDLLVLTGDARFVDDEHEQKLQAETLKLWLDDKDAHPPTSKDKPIVAKPTTDKPASEKAAADKPPPQQARRPHHLEALKNVMARSRDLNIHNTGRLVVWFKDVPEEQLQTPAARPEKAQTPVGPGNSVATTPASPPGPGSPPDRNRMQPGMHPMEPEKKEPPRPIDLTACSVEAWVMRSETKSTLEKLYTKGEVHVMQDPAKPEEKGVDIQGDELQMYYHPEGNLLVVTDYDHLAKLLLDKIYIVGTEVYIDQAANTAWVPCHGAMTMESNTTFDGNKMDKTVPMTVMWNERMFFNGKFAEFHGGIQAEQGKGHLACESLQVFFDRPISLKEGQKANEKPAKVDNMVCDRNVRIEDEEMEANKLVKWQMITAMIFQQQKLQNDEDQKPKDQKDSNEVNATGPGMVKVYQRGGPDPLAPPAPDANRPASKPMPKNPGEEDPMKLTFVCFNNRMWANTRSNTAKFWGNVRVLDMPSDDPKKNIDMETLTENLPKGALYLSCEQLTVLTRKEGPKASQEMEAVRRVVVQSSEFWGRCDKLTYNEAKDQIVFHGTDTEQARLYRQLNKGQQADELKGKKIIYIRSTGDFQVDGGNWIRGRQ